MTSAEQSDATLSVACFVAALLADAVFADITGPASDVDGDNLPVRAVKIQLSDINAPERRQTCWRAKVKFW